MKRRRVGLFVMIDALGARFLRQVEFLPELRYRVGLRAVLGFSCSCQPTLLSGRMPAEHGHGAMYMRRNGPSVLDAARPFHRLPSWIGDNHRVRARIYGHVARRVSGYFSLYDVPTHLLPRFDLVEQRSIFEPGGLRRAPSIFDVVRDLGLRFSTYDWRTPERDNLHAVERDLSRGKVDFIFLYLPGLDGLLHAHGPGSEPVLEHLGWYERELRRIFERAHDAADVVEAYVFSDHGMSAVHGGVDLAAEIEARFGENGRRYLAFYDSTMARFWIDEPRLGAELELLLTGRSDGRIVPEDEKKELGIAFDDRSQGDLLYVLNEGLIILPSYMGRTLLAGMHGYHPDAFDGDACLLGLASPAHEMTHIRDLFRLMEGSARRLCEDRD